MRAPSSRAGRRRILLVEDDVDTVELLEVVLDGYCVRTASSADVAHECLVTQVFDAYILDHYLPDGTGTELCAEIRQRNPLAPIVFVTGAARPVDKQAAMLAGATAFMVKPVDPLELRAVIDDLLAKADLHEYPSFRSNAC